jgi:hypothetical protein
MLASPPVKNSRPELPVADPFRTSRTVGKGNAAVTQACSLRHVLIPRQPPSSRPARPKGKHVRTHACVRNRSGPIDSAMPRKRFPRVPHFLR